MTDVRAELSKLRDRLTQQDEALVRLLAERMRVVREVASLKAGAGLAPFARGQEGDKMRELLPLASSLGLPLELVRDVFGALFAASRHAQHARVLEDEPRFSIGIVGGTRGMGAFLARVFGSVGYPVETMGLEGGGPAPELASRHDLVVVAVPIAATVDVIRALGPRVRPGACLMDVTSVKRAPLEAMLASTPPEVDVVGTHPMFGPHEGDDFDRQKVVLCKGRGEAGYARVRRLFEAFGAEIIDADAAEHDAQMAVIQVLVHEKTMVMGAVLERLRANLARSIQFASPIYRAELAMIGRLYSQSADLYADILTSNPDGARASTYFAEEAERFARAVANGEKAWLVERFRHVAGFLTEFAAWAKRESDAILHDVVRHG